MNGFLLFNKPIGLSSHQALKRVQHLFRAKKAGHTGNLDVLATGLLPIAFNEATKFTQFLLNADKGYEVVMTLGERTKTFDRESDVIEKKSADHISDTELLSAMQHFLGESEQVPSRYSAIKHQGKPLYAWTREGVLIDPEARFIQIYEISFLSRQANQVHFFVQCSKGTYIRSLVDDIGQRLGCGACVDALHRTSVGAHEAGAMYDWNTLVALREKEGLAGLQGLIQPLSKAFGHLPVIVLENHDKMALFQGKRLVLKDLKQPPLGLVSLLDTAGEFIGMGEIMDTLELRSCRLVCADSHDKSLVDQGESR